MTITAGADFLASQAGKPVCFRACLRVYLPFPTWHARGSMPQFPYRETEGNVAAFFPSSPKVGGGEDVLVVEKTWSSSVITVTKVLETFTPLVSAKL